MTKLFTDDDLEDPVEIEIPDDAPLKPFLEKYKDEKGVAKAIVEKDTFITRLQRENAEFRAKAVNEGNVAEIVDRLLASRTPTPNPELGTQPGSQQSEQPQTPSGISIADVEKLLAQKDQQNAAKTNATVVRQELEKLYGQNWVSEVKKKAKDLGESLEFMETLAQTKPAVMLKLFTTVTEPPRAPLFNNTVNTTAATLNAGTNQQRTMKYYQDMRAKDLVRYNSPAVQNQMHKDALQLREAFFDV